MQESMFKRVLRVVLGLPPDTNIGPDNPLEVHDPKVGSLISYEGVTTADGAPGGTTLECSDLAAPAHPDYNGNLVIITSGTYAGQARDINGTTLLGIVTPLSAFGGTIVDGTTFVIAALRLTPAEVAAIEAKLDALALICTEVRLAELNAGNIPADIDTLLTRLSALRAGYLNELDFDLQGALAAIAAAERGTDGALLAAAYTAPDNAGIATLLTRLSAIRAGYLDELAAANLPTDVANVKTQTDKIPTLLSFKDQWCAAPTASWALTNAGQDLLASNVVFPTGFLPAGATVQAIYLMFKWRKQKDSSAAENKISAASKTIRVMKNGATWGTNDIVAITYALNQLLTDADAVEGGDMVIGDVDVKAEVDDVDNETYNVATHNGDGNNDGLVVTAASLTLYDIYTGFRVYYTV